MKHNNESQRIKNKLDLVGLNTPIPPPMTCSFRLLVCQRGRMRRAN